MVDQRRGVKITEDMNMRYCLLFTPVVLAFYTNRLATESSSNNSPKNNTLIAGELWDIIYIAYYGVILTFRDYLKGYLFDPTAHDCSINPMMHVDRCS